jgi:uncharacterized membrane protein
MSTNLSTAIAAALFAATSLSLAEAPGSQSRSAPETSSSKCLSKPAAEREKCLREERVTSGTGTTSRPKVPAKPEVPDMSSSSKCLAMATPAEREKCLREEEVVSK